MLSSDIKKSDVSLGFAVIPYPQSSQVIMRKRIIPIQIPLVKRNFDVFGFLNLLILPMISVHVPRGHIAHHALAETRMISGRIDHHIVQMKYVKGFLDANGEPNMPTIKRMIKMRRPMY